MPVGIPLFCLQLFHHRHFKITLDQHLLESRIFLPEVPQLLDIVNLQRSKLSLPSIDGLLRDPVLSGGSFNWHRFGISYNAHNLFVREPFLLHAGPPPVEENLTYQMAKFRGALQDHKRG